MVIANGRRPSIISGVLLGTARATVFGPASEALSHRKRWIAFGRKAHGAIYVDDGARHALLHNGKSLLPAGVTRVEGSFGVGAAVGVLDAAGKEIARGLVNYGCEDLVRILGRKSKEIQAILGHKDFDEVIHRNNLVIL
jgi:glutamate 5-kinase